MSSAVATTTTSETADLATSNTSTTTSTSSNKMMMPPTTLFERLGGTEAVRMVVDDFYDRCLKDDRLCRFFESSRMSALRYHQLKFLKLAFTEIPADMDVKDMLLKKHKQLFQNGLSASHFDMVCGHLVDSLVYAKVSQQLIEEAAAILVPLRGVFEEGASTFGSNASNDQETNDNYNHDDGTDNENSTSPPAVVLRANDGRVTLMQRLGGAGAVKAAVEELYRRLLDDESLAPFFQSINMTRLKMHQVEFMKVAFSQIPDDLNVGQLMKDKHASLFANGLNETHFDKVAFHFVATLQHLSIAQELIDEAVGVVAPLREVFEEGAREAMERK